MSENVLQGLHFLPNLPSHADRSLSHRHQNVIQEGQFRFRRCPNKHHHAIDLVRTRSPLVRFTTRSKVSI